MAAADDVVDVVCSAASFILFRGESVLVEVEKGDKNHSNLSLAMLEFLDIDFGDISKSESDR